VERLAICGPELYSAQLVTSRSSNSCSDSAAILGSEVNPDSYGSIINGIETVWSRRSTRGTTVPRRKDKLTFDLFWLMRHRLRRNHSQRRLTRNTRKIEVDHVFFVFTSIRGDYRSGTRLAPPPLHESHWCVQREAINGFHLLEAMLSTTSVPFSIEHLSQNTPTVMEVNF